MTEWQLTGGYVLGPSWRLGRPRPVAGVRRPLRSERCTRRRSVLVVEDEPAIRALLVEFLCGEGYQVEVARDGHEALQLLYERGPLQRPGVVLLDMMLPTMDGLDVLQDLKAHGVGVPVVAMSASHEALIKALAAGARAILPKPFDLDRLLWTLERQGATA